MNYYYLALVYYEVHARFCEPVNNEIRKQATGLYVNNIIESDSKFINFVDCFGMTILELHTCMFSYAYAMAIVYEFRDCKNNTHPFVCFTVAVYTLAVNKKIVG